MAELEDFLDLAEHDEGDSPTFAAAKRADKTRNRLTDHFVIEEFDCNNGARVLRGRARTYEYLCNVFLEPLRRKYGPCTVNSGYRTPAYNRSVGGASRSIHVNDINPVDDVAADVRFAKGTPREWAASARWHRSRKRNGKGGIGTYGSFIHIDTRDYRTDWTG